MKKKPTAPKPPAGLRAEYDLTKLKGGVRGKYHSQALSGTNLVLIEPDLAQLFPNADAAQIATTPKRRPPR